MFVKNLILGQGTTGAHFHIFKISAAELLHTCYRYSTDLLQKSCRTPFICYIPHWKSLSQVYVLSAANILQIGCRPKNFKLIGFHHHMSMRNHKKIWKKFHLLLLQNLAHMFKIVMLSPFGSLHMEILFANRILEKLLWLSSWKTKSVNFRNVRRGEPKYFKMLGSYVKW